MRPQLRAFNDDLLRITPSPQAVARRSSTARVFPIPHFIFKGSLVDPRLRASNEQILIVRVPRVGGRPGYPSDPSETARCTSTGDHLGCPLMLLPNACVFPSNANRPLACE